MNNKELVAKKAASLVKDGMIVGLGTGSTADCFIIELAHRVATEQLTLSTVASSVATGLKAQAQGLPLIAIEHLTQLDLYVDGADEVTLDNTVLKGQGADLVKEKLLARASDQFIVLVDASKQVNFIGEHFPIPIEVMPFAWQLVKTQLENLGARGCLRQREQGQGIAVTSQGNLVLDMSFDRKFDSIQLDTLLSGMPGVVEHGIFQNLANLVLLGVDNKIQTRSTQPI